MFLPGESQGRGAWWAAVYGVTESDTTEVTYQQQQQHCYQSQSNFIANPVPMEYILSDILRTSEY